MLTDRQEKIFKQLYIYSMQHGLTSTAPAEMSVILRARNDVNFGQKSFGDVMRKLIVDLEGIKGRTNSELTPAVEELLSSIKIDYGA